MNYAAYPGLANNYADILTKARKRYGTMAADSANHQMARFLFSEYQGGTSTLIAQTRIASSYGLLQILYSTAVGDEEFAETVPPEELNITDIGMKLSIERQKRMLRERLRLNRTDEGEDNWGVGYEQAFLTHVYHQWNSRTGYPLEVFRFSRLYLPR